MSTNNKNKRRDELNKVSGGVLSIGGNLNARIDLNVDSSKLEKIKLDNSQITNPRRQEDVCIRFPCGSRW